MAEPIDRCAALPPKPEPPDPSECCGNGCDPCVHDLHDEQLAAWRRRVAAIESQARGAAGSPSSPGRGR